MSLTNSIYRLPWKIISLTLVIILLFSPGLAPDARAAAPAADGSTWLPASAGDRPAAPQASALASTSDWIDLSFTFSGVQAEPVQLGGAPYTHLAAEGFGSDAAPGQPDLPFLGQVVQIPYGASYSLEITRAVYRDVRLADLGLVAVQPAQVPHSKSGPVPPVAAPDAAAYAANTFQPAQPAALGTDFIQRGRRGVNLLLHPVLYNPQSGVLRIYSRLEVRIQLKGGSLALSRWTAARYASPEFEPLQAATFLNYGQTGAEPAPLPPTPPAYLIISADTFVSDLAPFVALKQSHGYAVTLVGLSTTGATSAEIKAYIQNFYAANPSLAYLLLVGDLQDGADTLPAWPKNGWFYDGLYRIAYNHYTDLDYALLAGTDSVPEIGYGRFPVRDTAQLAAMVNKAVAYEALTGSEVWVKKAAFLATDDPTYWSFAEATHNYVINTYTTSAGFTGTFPNNTQPGGDKLYAVTYTANTTSVTNALNDGRGIVVYSGHGNDYAWSGPGFGLADVSSMTSNGVYAYVAGHACMTGRWNSNPSLAETWVTQVDKGALVYLGASDYTYWEQDDLLERRMFDALFAVSQPSLAAMLEYGNSAVASLYGADWALYYRQEYHLFGDPSVKILLSPKLQDFSLSLNPTQVNVCSVGQSLGEKVISNITLGSLFGFSAPVTLSLLDAPQGLVTSFNLNPATPPNPSQLYLEGNNVAVGNYALTVQGNSGSLTHSAPLAVSVFPPLDAPALTSPANGAVDQALRPTFTWVAVPGATSYYIEVAEDAGFSVALLTAQVTEPSFTPVADLPAGKPLYWRVVAANVCKSISAPFNFTTGTPLRFYFPMIMR